MDKKAEMLMDSVEKEINYLDRCVDQFADEMRIKLYKKAHQGWRGWDKPRIISNSWLEGMLFDHIKNWLVLKQNSQEVDVANLAMFLWVRRMKNEPEKCNDCGTISGAEDD